MSENLLSAESEPFTWPRIVTVTGLFLLAALAALSFDVPLARWAVTGGCPRSIHEYLEMHEAFGHGGGVALVLAAVWLLDVAGRKRIVRIAAASLSAGLLADLLKACIARQRPRDFNFLGGALDTFVSWLPLAGNRSGAQGFPSAHTATAVALAVALAWAYPRARYLFVFLAVIVGIQRAECSAHFASDVLAGAAVGWLAGSCMLRWDACFGALAWLESRFPGHPANDSPPGMPAADSARRAA